MARLSSALTRLSRVALQEKKRVGVLGASGAVGSRFCYMLNEHPWFELVALGGGPDEVGSVYGAVVKIGRVDTDEYLIQVLSGDVLL